MRFLDWIIVGLVPAAFALAAFVVGAAVGSGLNVLIYRLPRGKSPFWPPSSCGACRSRIRWHDNVPILGYLRLRGRCRDCGTKFSLRYMVMELLVGLGFAGLLLLDLFRDAPNSAAGEIPSAAWLRYLVDAYLFALAVVQFCCRLDGAELPTSVALPGLLGGPLVAVLTPLGPAGWLAGLAAGWLLSAVVRFGPISSASGDVLFLVTAGGLFGWQAVTVAALLASVLALLARFAQRHGWPFGAWLAVGVVLVLFGAHFISPSGGREPPESSRTQGAHAPPLGGAIASAIIGTNHAPIFSDERAPHDGSGCRDARIQGRAETTAPSHHALALLQPGNLPARADLQRLRCHQQAEV